MTKPLHLWSPVAVDASELPTGVTLGCRRRAGAPKACGPVLAEVASPGDIGDADAWIVPQGLATHLSLLARLADTGKPGYLPVNGLGARTLAQVMAELGGAEVLPTIDLAPLDPLAQAEQLAWLAATGWRFAAAAADPQALAAAYLAKPDAILVEGDAGALAQLLALARVDRCGGPRPISTAELDALPDGAAALTVTRRLEPGHTLALDDLTVVVSDEDGLSPLLARRIAGRTLRYTVEPGEALTFGHLHGVVVP